MNSSSLGAVAFERLIENYSEKVGAILGNEKSQYLASPENCPHSYQDKYVLAEQLTSCIGAIAWNILTEVGITLPMLEKILSASNHSTVKLRLESSRSCKFLKDQVGTVKISNNNVQTEVSQSILTGIVTTEAVKQVTEFKVKYKLMAIIGAGKTDADIIIIRSRSATQELLSRFQQSSTPEVQTFRNEFDIHQLISLLRDARPHSNEQGRNSLCISFSINRMHQRCFTPIRNPDIEAAVAFFDKMYLWLNEVSKYFTEQSFTVPWRFKVTSKDDEIFKIASAIFIPLVPLFRMHPGGDGPSIVDDYSSSSMHPNAESTSQESISAIIQNGTSLSLYPSSSSSSSLLQSSLQLQDFSVLTVYRNGMTGATIGAEDLSLVLQEHRRSLVDNLASLQKLFVPTIDPNSITLFSMAEARLSALFAHLQLSIQAFLQLIRFIEDLMRTQLTAALGRELSPIDLQLYMSFHHRKLFRSTFQPVPFCYTVRRSPAHSPEVWQIYGLHHYYLLVMSIRC